MNHHGFLDISVAVQTFQPPQICFIHGSSINLTAMDMLFRVPFILIFPYIHIYIHIHSHIYIHIHIFTYIPGKHNTYIDQTFINILIVLK